jgi:hypothetical protein
LPAYKLAFIERFRIGLGKRHYPTKCGNSGAPFPTQHKGTNNVARIKIISDSTADISAELAQELDIDLIPTQIQFGDQSFRAGAELSNDQYYQLIDDGRLRPRFLPPSEADLDATFRRVTERYDYIFSIHMAAQLSPIYRMVQQTQSRIPATCGAKCGLSTANRFRQGWVRW